VKLPLGTRAHLIAGAAGKRPGEAGYSTVHAEAVKQLREVQDEAAVDRMALAANVAADVASIIKRRAEGPAAAEPSSNP